MEQNSVYRELFVGLVRNSVESGVDYFLLPLDEITLDLQKLKPFEMEGLQINLGYLTTSNVLLVYPENKDKFTKFVIENVLEYQVDNKGMLDEMRASIFPAVYGKGTVDFYMEYMYSIVNEDGIGFVSLFGGVDEEPPIVDGKTVLKLILGVNGAGDLLSKVEVYDIVNGGFVTYDKNTNFLEYLGRVSEVGSDGSSLVFMFRVKN